MVVPLPDDAVTAARLFGKLPAHGDFVARGVRADERDALDRWLTASLEDARAAFGDEFDDRYAQTPPWRFAGVIGGRWTSGALALSIDGAGRRFPVYAEISGAEGLGAALATAAAIELTLHEAIAETWTADSTLEALVTAGDEMEHHDGAAAGAREGWWTEDDAGAVVADARPADLVRRMLAGGVA